MAVSINHLTTKAVLKVELPGGSNKTSSSTYLINPNVTDEIIFNSMMVINSLMDLPAFKVLKVVSSELIN